MRHTLGIGRWCSLRTGFALVPNGIVRKQKRATLASTLEGRRGLPFSVDAKVWPHKSRYANGTLYSFGLGRPFSERKGDEAKLPLHYRFDTQRLLSKNTARMGDKAKPLVFRGPAALLCELGLFVLAITSRKIEMQSDPRASDI